MAALHRPARLCFALALAACGGNEGAPPPSPTAAAEDESFAQGGADASSAETDVQLVASSLVSSGDTGVGLVSVSANAADVRTVFFPRTCVTLANDSASRTARFTFNGCVGPSGLRDLTGSVVVRYAFARGSASLDVTYENLSVNDARVEGTAAATIEATGATRAMTWKADLRGTTAGGRAFARQAATTIRWTLGEPCFDLDGATEGEVAGRRVRIEINDYRRCRRGCPDAGGKIVVTNVTKNVSVQILFDGTNRATYVGADGDERALPLLCRT